MKKYTWLIVFFCIVVVGIFATGRIRQTEQKQPSLVIVKLSVSASEDSQDIVKQMVESFKKEYEKEANFDIRISVEEEKSVWENFHKKPKEAADVFAFADEQIDNMVRDDILLPITLNREAIIEAAGGIESTAVKSSVRDDVLYAYPMTASNGYYLYYNAEYFTDEDVETLDRILEVAEAKGKYFAMDWTSGWYLYSFFKGAGMDVVVNEDRVTNTCDWNRKEGPFTGRNVAEAMLDIAKSPAFFNAPDVILKNGFRSGDVIAGVSGAWNAQFMEECMGENCRAAKLPSYTVNGQQIQMASFEGFKLIGVNRHTEEAQWAMRLAEWITNYENQILRYKEIGEKPANVAVIENGDIQVSKAVMALQEQSEYSNIQRIGSNYWDATTIFGTMLASGNLDQVNIDVLLDELVETLATNQAE